MAEQPKDSVVFHCDCNAFYASVEALDNPALREVPMAVAGSPESRRGIVLAKNEQAKARGIFTTQTVWQAKKLCPELMLVPPRHDRYAEISRQVNALYMQYTDLVEPASIDESYLDVTGSLPHFGLSAHALGDQVRRRVREEIGITISVGISFCKAFAKMGSDLKKPDATTEITRENYRDILWPLPVGALLYAGKRTCEQLRMQGIHTVGDLARTDRQALAALLGRGGDALWLAANGLEDAPVVPPDEQPAVKSVGNGRTFPRDLVTYDEVRRALITLSDEVATRLREAHMMCRAVQVSIKDPKLKVIVRQMQVGRPTWQRREISDTALKVMAANWREGAPIRALTVTAENLIPADQATEQISLFDAVPQKQREKQEKLERAVLQLRKKYGADSILLGPGDEEH
ncbi:MAG: DNA polymerase Y family protein [Christensenellales bacterium]|jgi:DNA polymerase-4